MPNIFNIIWKLRGLIILLVLGCWLWYEHIQSERRKAETERMIAAQLQEKKMREHELMKSYHAKKTKRACNIEFEVTLDTYGSTVNVELRVGNIGNSFPLVVKQATDGKLEYTDLCPGSYFLAIGDDKNVATTPIKLFTTGNRYASRVYLTKGSGNMGSSRRELL